MNNIRDLTAVVNRLKSTLGEGAVLESEADRRAYGKDWLKDYEPNPLIILLPSTIEQVQECMRICNAEGVAVVPSGGRTGLSGGATALHGEVVLSMQRMNKILSVNRFDRTIICQAGVVTQKLQDEALKNNLYFPVDFASRGSSQIGGNVATNAGGIRVIRYGNMREWVLSMKVVTANGDLLELSGPLFKNQTGYDLKELFIGSEGTLGVIVELTMRLAGQPGNLSRILCGTDRLDKILQLLSEVRDRFEDVSAFEFFTRNALDKVMSHHRLPDPLSTRHNFYVVVEFERSDRARLENLETGLAEILESDLIQDVVISQSDKQAGELLAYRELISETLSTLHVVHKNDISIPIASIPGFIEKLNAEIADRYPGYEVVTFGHIGDGNLHVNILKPEALDNASFFSHCKEADHHLFAIVQQFSGSISAEHGVGLLKKAYLGYSRSPMHIAYMKAIKQVFDPKNILNPGKIFDI